MYVHIGVMGLTLKHNGLHISVTCFEAPPFLPLVLEA